MQKRVVFFLLLFVTEVLSDELVRIQTVSKDRSSFVVALGKGDGIQVGQSSLFSTRKISLMASAVEVNRYYSLWNISEKEGVVPFKRNQFVNFSKQINSIFIEVPRLHKLQADVFHKEKYYWMGKWNYSFSLSESVSGASSSDQVLRTGSHFEIGYVRDWTTKLDWGVGFRYDREVSSRQNPGLEIPNAKIFVTGDIYYHFSHLGESKINPYLGLGLGIGYSNTSISSTVSKGFAMILPALKVGLQTEVAESKFLLFEGVIESVSATETFGDGTEQKTSTLNAKAAAGLKF
ncbi:hypothetical protein OAK75_07665 [Bacteriovoracales bacterium]|nr:hypothetical protein [Bacteriovoracales bacterium]